MITKNIAAFCSEFEKKLAHETIEKTIEEMCGKSSIELSNVFGL